MIELVEMEVREELSAYGYPGDDVPVVCGSALSELQNTNPELGRAKILELMAAVDDNFPQSELKKFSLFLEILKKCDICACFFSFFEFFFNSTYSQFETRMKRFSCQLKPSIKLQVGE